MGFRVWVVSGLGMRLYNSGLGATIGSHCPALTLAACKPQNLDSEPAHKMTFHVPSTQTLSSKPHSGQAAHCVRPGCEHRGCFCRMGVDQYRAPKKIPEKDGCVFQEESETVIPIKEPK